MYGKIFASMYEGSLYGQWQAIVTFQQLIVLCDADGVVDMTPQAIAARTSIPLEIIEAGLKILSEPDKYSRSPDSDGRRIELIDPDVRPWGWSIVNHNKYKYLQDMDTVRAANRERQRKHRAKSQAVTGGHAPSRHTDTDTDTDTKKKNASALPDWLDKEAWATWNDHRAELRKKQTAKSIASQLRFLEKYKADHTAILDQSVRNGWTGLFELKADYRKPEPSRTVKDFPA
jgi:hypothetical protein